MHFSRCLDVARCRAQAIEYLNRKSVLKERMRVVWDRGGVLTTASSSSGEISRTSTFPNDDVLLPRQSSVGGISIPFDLPVSFSELSHTNTSRGIETCGILLGTSAKGSYSITTLVIPRQTGTRDTCESLSGSEEEILAYALGNNLVCLGWIHTHPTQSCFLSSVDMHTTLPYQQMLGDAVAIVVAPTDKHLPIGVWRLTPAGIAGIARCRLRGFHDHDGKDAFSQVATDTNWDPNLRVVIVDLRKRSNST